MEFNEFRERVEIVGNLPHGVLSTVWSVVKHEMLINSTWKINHDGICYCVQKRNKGAKFIIIRKEDLDDISFKKEEKKNLEAIPALKRGDEFEYRIASKFIHIRKNAASRGLDFDLSLSDIRKLLKKKTCFYTGVRLQWDTLEAPRPFNTFTIDRINPKEGYVPGNVVPCCHGVNLLKERLEHSDPNGLSFKEKTKFMKKYLEVV